MEDPIISTTIEPTKSVNGDSNVESSEKQKSASTKAVEDENKTINGVAESVKPQADKDAPAPTSNTSTDTAMADSSGTTTANSLESSDHAEVTPMEIDGKDGTKEVQELATSKPQEGDAAAAPICSVDTNVTAASTGESSDKQCSNSMELDVEGKEKANEGSSAPKPQGSDTVAAATDAAGGTAVHVTPASNTTPAAPTNTGDNPPPPVTPQNGATGKTDQSLSTVMNQKYATSIHGNEDSDDDNRRVKKIATKKGGNSDVGTRVPPTALPQCTMATDTNQPTTSAALTVTTPSTKENKNNAQKTPKEFETEREETSWEEILLDAEEFESLMFSIRRPSARNRLQDLSKQLKQLSAKLKRHHEVMHVRRSLVAAKKRKTPTKERDEGNNASLDGKAVDNASAATGVTENGGSSTATGSKRVKLEVVDEKSGKNSGETQVSIPLFAMDRTARPNAGLGTTSSGTPILKEKDKFVHHHRFGSNLHCPDFDATGKCPLGAICHHLHVYRPPSDICNKVPKYYTRDDLKRAYETQRNVTLTRTEFSEKIKADALNVPKYTLGFTCPIDKTVYYAQPFPSDQAHNLLTQNGGGVKSSQGVWWYRNMKEASEALSTIVLEDLIRRKVITDRFQPERAPSGDAEVQMRKKNASARAAALARMACVDNTPVLNQPRLAPVGLPQIHPWNWMEVDYEQRCTAFHTTKGCNRGMRCRNAHVHYPSPNIARDKGRNNSRRFPDLGAMPKAYYQNFGMVLEDPFFQADGSNMTGGSHLARAAGRGVSSFKTKSAVDARNQIWYTAAWKCPREGTIYYAAGGVSGRVNSQNMFLYPSVEQAKLAACGVVLDAFFDRGMRGDWEVPELPPSAIARDGSSVLSISPSGARAPEPRWLGAKTDNRGLVPHWQANLDCTVTPQPQIRSVDRNMQYSKSGMDPRLLLSASSVGGTGRFEASRMIHQQARQYGTVHHGMNLPLAGEDQGLEKELFG